ncbi:MAG: ABC transporter ATP-binding protein, partial [Candidatus Thorarchaeota archaeon]
MAHVRRGPGRALTIDKYKRARSTKVLVNSLWKYLRKYIAPIITVAVLSILYSVTSLINPIIIRNGINSITEGNSTFRALVPLTIIFFVLTIIGWIITSISTRIQARMNSKMLHEVRLDLYEKLNYSDMSYLKKEQSGNITARVTADTGELATGVQLSSGIVSHILLIVGSFVILLVTNWIIALISLAAIPIAFLMSAVLSYFGRKIVLRIRRAFGFVSGKMAEGLTGIAVAKSFNREEELATELRELNQQHYKYSKQFGMLMMFVMPTMRALTYLLFTVIIYVSGWINKSTTLPLGDIYLAINLSQQFLFPIVMLAMVFPQLEAAFGAMDRIIDIFEAKPAVEDLPEAVDLQQEDDSVFFENITFAYEEDINVLEDVSFVVKPGEMIAIVGATGAGKTTLMSSLLTRFYDIPKGSIKIGSQDIKNVTQSSLRKAIGLVTQEPFLFSGSV